MSLAHNTDVAGTGLARLLQQYKGLPRMEALLRSWLDECQELEDAAWTLWINRQLQQNLATGDLLKKLGELVGQTSLGLSDDVFNLLIRARIFTNRSDGKRAKLIRIAQLLVPNTPIEVREYVGAVVVTAMGPVTVPPDVIAAQFLERAQLGGVRMTFGWMETPLASTIVGGYSRGGITQPTVPQSPGYWGGGPMSGFYIAGGAAAGALSADGGSSS